MQQNQFFSYFSLKASQQVLLFILSLFIVAFGQPAWFAWTGILTSLFGYALVWRVLLVYPQKNKRFWLATGWFTCVQLIQLSWFISHPYWYIYTVYFLISLLMGIQFGLIGLFITPRFLQNARSMMAIAALWVVFEWSRLFIFSGLSWNPSGLALSGTLYSLQFASLAGVFGLSFWVFIVNLVVLRAWITRSKACFSLWILIAFIPYLYGMGQLQIHHQGLLNENAAPPFKAVLVQTAFPIEEADDSPAKGNLKEFVMSEWKQILEIIKKHHNEIVDLVVMPEFVVPYGTYAFVYPLDEVIGIFKEVWGEKSLPFLPAPHFPYGSYQQDKKGRQILVNNAYWLQAIANYFDADVLAGLEDAEDFEEREREYYSSAMLFHSKDVNEIQDPQSFVFPERYEKRILVPMGEYIPFTFCKNLAAHYGVFGSFTCGREAKVMTCKNLLISPSICYEETFGGLMTEGRQKGAHLLVNLTSDAWYPNSKLARQHFDHAKLRTVENGVPLIRSCNTGFTCAIDSFGRTTAMLGGDHPEKVEWIADSLLVTVPPYTYFTFYSLYGDTPLICLCFFIIFIAIISYKKSRKQLD